MTTANGEIQHPAKFSECLLPKFATLLRGARNVLDPMAGTGKLACIKAYGYTGRVVCNELEPEWADSYAVDEWHFSDAAAMEWANDESFDAICTSPTYGNRMADHHHARDGSRRFTYRHLLGRMLHPANTGQLQWGTTYREKHTAIYRECLRVLKVGGLMVINISDHIRQGRHIFVTDWHSTALQGLGLTQVDDLLVSTPRMGYGAHRGLRVNAEHILIFEK